MRKPVMIAGAGPAGLAASLAVARAGGQAQVVERRGEVGARFHGDFQGLENWSTKTDALEDLAALGIEPSFDFTPFRECVFFGPGGREHTCRSNRPLWYLVRRGSDDGTLDQALKAQAIAAGVQLEFGRNVDHLPDGGIVAHGPRRVDAIAVGYVFETDKADGAFGVLSNRLAAGGYSYLLIAGGRATLAACLFSDFHNEKTYLARTLEFFQAKVGITMRAERRFGGFGNISIPPEFRRGKLLFAGEAAGVQDALFGFGMRGALLSGNLAGQAFAGGNPLRYEQECARRLLPLNEAAAVNRFFFERAGHAGYRHLLRAICKAPDPCSYLHNYYRKRWWTRLAYPFARRALKKRMTRTLHTQCRSDCDCTYCRCLREIETSRARSAAQAMEGSGKQRLKTYTTQGQEAPWKGSYGS